MLASRNVRWCRWWCLLVSVALLPACEGRLPSDEALLDHFMKNRQTFERLARMIVEDGIIAMHGSTVRVEEKHQPLDEQDTRNYQQLLQELGVKAVWRTGAGGAPRLLEFYVAEAGWPMCYKNMAYVYTTMSPEELSTRTRAPIVESLTGRRRAEDHAYRHIEGPWYLYFSPCSS